MKKVFIIIIIALGVFGYFVYSIFHDQYYSETTDGQLPKNTTSDSQKNSVDRNNTIKTETDSPIMEMRDETASDTKDSGSSKASVSRKDCDKDCQNFSSDSSLITYCEQVCGIAPIQKNATGCDAKSGIEKDYCQKDLAVVQLNASLCDSIQDANIKKTCKNRVTEEILEKR